MSEAAVWVRRPGLLTTVQDLGRPGCQADGVSVSGAADPVAHRIGNALVGNDPGAAALEITLLGPELEFTRPLLVALTGADLGARLQGRPLPRWLVAPVAPGDRLEFTGPVSGCRAYLAVAGGFDIAPVLGSRSTDTLGALGGQVLQAGAGLAVGPAPAGAAAGRRLLPSWQPVYPAAIRVRAVPGPQAEAFTPAALAAFWQTAYTVTARSDRVGCRLAGPPLGHRRRADVISEGVAPGSVQVPADGQPIVMLADRQTMGGYAKIATVITPDLGRVAQLPPGGRLSFQSVTVDAARVALAEHRRWLGDAATRGMTAAAVRRLRLLIAGQSYEVTVEEL